MMPRAPRRLLLPAALLTLTVLVIVASPLLALVAFLIDLVRPGAFRTVRLLWLAVTWLVLEVGALAATIFLWVRGSRWEVRHYAVVQRFVGRLYDIGTETFRLTVDIEEPPLPGPERAEALRRPVIVLSRHAGMGNSFLLIHHLMESYGRRPRIVLKDNLQYDPALDVVLNRLPNSFVGSDGDAVVTEIGALAATLGMRDALVIFPEGRDFSPRRRRRAIRRLQRKGRWREAARARAMPNMLPPRPRGALAALASARQADVIFVAHTGLEDLLTPGDLWRGMPVGRTVRARWWRVPAEDIPTGEEARVSWLYDWWKRLDLWVSDNRSSVPER